MASTRPGSRPPLKRSAGPESEIAATASSPWHGEATHTDLLLLLVCGPTVVQDRVELACEGAELGDRLVSTPWQAGAAQQAECPFTGHRREQHVAHRCGVRRHVPADLREHPQGVRGRRLGDIHDIVALQDGQVRGLTGDRHQVGQVRPGVSGQRPLRGVAET